MTSDSRGLAPAAAAAAAPPEAAPRPQSGPAEEERVSAHIVRCADGKYRWVYGMHLLKNPTVFLLVWKIFFFILLGIFVFTTVVDAISWPGEFLPNLLNGLRFFGWILLGMTILVAVGCFIYAAMMGWRYTVLFEMDEEGVNHKQLPRQAEKAQLISDLTVLAGLAAGNITTVGVGLNAARSEMYSSFSAVRKVKCYPRRGLIKVNGLLSRNQVYAAPEDFAFVRDYILARCTRLR